MSWTMRSGPIRRGSCIFTACCGMSPVVAVVSILFRQLSALACTRGLAALVYGMSHTHADAGCSSSPTATRCSGVFFGVTALLLHHRWRQRGRPSRGRTGFACPLARPALERGRHRRLRLPPLLCRLHRQGDDPRSALSLVPYAMIVLRVAALLSASGHGAWASEAYIDPLASPLRFLEAATIREPLYLLAQLLLPPTDWSRLVSPQS